MVLIIRVKEISNDENSIVNSCFYYSIGFKKCDLVGNEPKGEDLEVHLASLYFKGSHKS
jgi:hypothetical protein